MDTIWEQKSLCNFRQYSVGVIMEKHTEKKSQILAGLMYKAIVRYSKQKTLRFQSKSKCKFVLDFRQQQSANTNKEFTIRKD